MTYKFWVIVMFFVTNFHMTQNNITKTKFYDIIFVQEEV